LIAEIDLNARIIWPNVGALLAAPFFISLLAAPCFVDITEGAPIEGAASSAPTVLLATSSIITIIP
jgi:hypothetical protein